MKLKSALTTGLLFFSQAAAAAARGTPEWAAETVGAARGNVNVNEQNYRGKMCSTDLFTIPALIDGKADGRIVNMQPPYDRAAKERADSMKTQFDAYCYASEKYDKAVESKKTATGSSVGEADREIQKNGMTVATACEGLKQHKKLNLDEFNSYFVRPKTCPGR